jgi:glutamyl-tRNA synthetase
MSKQIRTRFAPSPTGYIHIGNVMAALVPFLIARRNNGKFILRIEDTDRARYVDDATQVLMDTLSWLGLEWDEGPVLGSEKDGKWAETGDFGPYFQTKRQDSYVEWAEKLIKKGRAYADPYTEEEVQTFREKSQAKKKAFLYRDYRPENPPKWKKGMPLRFKTEPKSYAWHDEVYGELSSGPEVLDDIILIKSDGLPTYNFAHIIDDRLMNCSYVTRGKEYLSSIPNYMALYEALEITPPKFVHTPHIQGPDGQRKLGKRDGAKSVQEYRADGFLPETMVNFLTLLAWNDGTEQEIFSLDELIKKFSVDRIQRGGARFDEQRLIWMNGQWIRRLPQDELYERSKPFWPEVSSTYEDAYKKQVLSIIYDRLKVLSDLRTMTTYFFVDPKIDLSLITTNKFLKVFSESELIDFLRQTTTKLRSTTWESLELQRALNALLEQTTLRPPELFSLIRISLSFAPFSPALNDTLAVLGREVSLARLERVIEALSAD